MKIDLTELLQKVGNEADLEQIEKLNFPDDDLNLTQPVRVRIHLVNTGDTVLVTGQAETEAELQCSRCLKAFNLPLSIKIEEEFSRTEAQIKDRGEVELKEEDFVYPISKDNTIDLSDILRQDLLLAIPIKTLCSPDCKGIDPGPKSREKGEK